MAISISQISSELASEIENILGGGYKVILDMEGKEYTDLSEEVQTKPTCYITYKGFTGGGYEYVDNCIGSIDNNYSLYLLRSKTTTEDSVNLCYELNNKELDIVGEKMIIQNGTPKFDKNVSAFQINLAITTKFKN